MVSKTLEYNTMTFADFYSEFDDFQEDYEQSGFPTLLTEENIRTLYYLLCARFANSPIANMDINQFKYKLFAVIWQYGPTWQKRIEIQSKVRELTDEQLLQGSKQIYNHAFNPSSDPTTATTEELEFINEQNTSIVKRGVLEAYQTLWSLLDTDVTEEFLNRFTKLFKVFVYNENPLVYITDEEEEENE